MKKAWRMRMQTKMTKILASDDDDDDQDEATEKKHDNLVNLFQKMLFWALGMSEEEKTIIKKIFEIDEHNLNDEVNGFEKVGRQHRINRLFQQDYRRVYQLWMENLKVEKSLTQNKAGDFGVTFRVLESVTIKMLNG